MFTNPAFLYGLGLVSLPVIIHLLNRQRYRRVSRRGQRAVVPVLQGICYGCFMAVPTAWAAEAERNERLVVCQNCGRFLYHVD